MKLVGKVPVEPLDDERLTNIERRLVVRVSELRDAHVRPPRRMLAFAGVAMAIALAAFAGYRLHRDPVVTPPAPESLAMTSGALDLGDAQITGTDFTVTRGERRVDIVMTPGRLDLHVEHDPRRLYVVRAGDVEVEDVGTRFTVDYDGTHVDVRVTEGAVKVKHAGTEVQVAANQAWGLDIGPVTIAQLDEARAPAGDIEVAAVEPDVAPNESGSAPDARGTPSSARDARGSADARGTGSGGASRGSGARQGKGESAARKALEKAPYEPPYPVGTDDPKAAIAKYLEHVKSMTEGEDKAQLIYSLAVMYHRAGMNVNAKRMLPGVLRRQGGTWYKPGLWLLVRIECLASFDDACRNAAEKFLANADSGPQAGIAQEILREISRGQ
ncbi:MAG TPA: FecR family protein [Kofleriaceae bacterium]|nr:FecR family protein [Kofleriaceae bacterium]